MNEGKPDHPSKDDLSAFGLGRLDEEAASTIESHLAGCPECHTFVEGLPEDEFIWKLRNSVQVGDPGTSPARLTPSPHEAPTLLQSTTPVAGAAGQGGELAGHSRYRILRVLGSGGMGTVYHAEHQLMERPVALKVIKQDLTRDPGMVERFRREVKGAARLTHPNIVTAFDAEQVGDAHFLVMEYVEGTRLDQMVAGQGPLAVDRACDLACQAARGLQHAFEKGMVHRDIKPANLIVTPEGRVKILDFGLARFAREAEAALPIRAEAPAATVTATSLTQVGSLMGTPDYMAPEQARDAHAADIRADLYSLGCTLYFLLTGQPPFPHASGVDKIMAHLEQRPMPLASFRGDVPPGLKTVLDRLLAKDPARRYQTPAELIQSLEPFTQAPAPAVPSQVQTKTSPPQPPRRGTSWRLILGGCGGAAVVGGLAVLVFGAGDEDSVRERMTTVYDLCAILGGTVMACQFLLSLLGLGHHEVGGEGHDFAGHDLGGHDHVPGGGAHGHDHGESHDQQSIYVSLLTFRTVVAALVFFGLAGRAATAASLDIGPALVIALAAGAGALFLVAWLMRSLHQLRADGTVRIERAVGKSGTVYLPVPGQKAGRGKVMLNLQNRTVEYQAVTAQEGLSVGAKITVVGVINADTVEVSLAPTAERATHV